MKRFVLHSEQILKNAVAAIHSAAPESVVTITSRTRSNEQNAKLHAMLSDLAASPVTWFGKRRTLDEWKVLMISAHAVATDGQGEVIPGIEGEMVAIRESSASMSVGRCASLIEYLQAFGDQHGVAWQETERGGFMGARRVAA